MPTLQYLSFTLRSPLPTPQNLSPKPTNNSPQPLSSIPTNNCPQSLSTKPTNHSPQPPSTKPTNHFPQNLRFQETNLPLQFKEKILCLEIMGIDSSKALSLNPSLLSAPLDSIQSIITFLQNKGIHQKDLGRIFGMCPRILTSDIKDDLKPVFEFLSHDLQVPDKDFRRVVNKCPRLLVSSVQDQLKPALIYLKRLGVMDIGALAYQDSVLLVSSVEKTIIPKLEFLESLGFSRDDVVEMVVRSPGILTFSIENNFKPKFGYYVEEMGGSLEELKGFPQYFAFSLEKRIKPRHREVVEKGVGVALSVMLKSTDEEFRELLKEGGDPSEMGSQELR